MSKLTEINKISKDLYLIEDWQDCDSSVLEKISIENFLESGVEVFSKQDSPHIVPHLITTSYPHAKSLALILKEIFNNITSNRKLRVLETGAGSGIFSRNFLIAARELGFLDSIEYLVSDISELGLKQIRDNKILDGFTEGEHYKFISLDLLNINDAKDLDGENFEVKDLDLVIFNYVLDQIPMLPIRRVSDSEFKKLQIRILTQHLEYSDLSNIKKLKNLRSLEIEKRWVNWELDSLDPLKKQHFDLLNKLFNKEPERREAKFSPLTFEMFNTLKDRLTDLGAIYISDMQSKISNSQKSSEYFGLFGGTKANLIEEPLIILYFESLGYSHLHKREANLARLFFFKNESMINKQCRNAFFSNNDLEAYNQIITMFPQIKDPSLIKVAKALLDRFLEIDNVSATALTFQGSYHFLLKEYDKALAFYKEALKIDFSSQWQLEFKINGTEAFI